MSDKISRDAVHIKKGKRKDPLGHWPDKVEESLDVIHEKKRTQSDRDS